MVSLAICISPFVSIFLRQKISWGMKRTYTDYIALRLIIGFSQSFLRASTVFVSDVVSSKGSMFSTIFMKYRDCVKTSLRCQLVKIEEKRRSLKKQNKKQINTLLSTGSKNIAKGDKTSAHTIQIPILLMDCLLVNLV